MEFGGLRVEALGFKFSPSTQGLGYLGCGREYLHAVEGLGFRGSQFSLGTWTTRGVRGQILQDKSRTLNDGEQLVFSFQDI